MAGDYRTRASDRDRDDTVAILCDAYAAGRLGLGDVRDRAGAAYCARAHGDLRRLTADLPRPRPPAPASARRPAAVLRRSPKRYRAATLLAVLAALTLAAAAFMPVLIPAAAVLTGAPWRPWRRAP